MSVFVTDAAWIDVNKIADEWAKSSLAYGADFVERFEATLTFLESFPRFYGKVNRAPRGREIRCARIGKTMYLATYDVCGDDATVFCVWHARRRPPWRKRLQDI
jgi:hypothetical protein